MDPSSRTSARGACTVDIAAQGEIPLALAKLRDAVTRVALSYIDAFRRAPPRDRASIAIVLAGFVGALALVLGALTIRASRPPERVALADPRERAPRAALVPARTAEMLVEAPAAAEAPAASSARPAKPSARTMLDRRF
jgi:hypothetical protein